MGETDRKRRSPFPSTHWTLLEAVRGEPNPDQQAALDMLAERYWRPAYIYVRSRGIDRMKAEDIVQDFFTNWLKRNLFGRADARKGRFRSFFLTSLNHFIKNAIRHESSGRRMPPAGFSDAESEALPDANTPDTVFYRAFVADLTRQVLIDLEKEYTDGGKRMHFCIFQERLIFPVLEGIPPTPMKMLAEKYGISEKQAANYLLTARRAYRRLLEGRIREYAASDKDIEAELGELLSYLDRSR